MMLFFIIFVLHPKLRYNGRGELNHIIQTNNHPLSIHPRPTLLLPFCSN